MRRARRERRGRRGQKRNTERGKGVRDLTLVAPLWKFISAKDQKHAAHANHGQNTLHRPTTDKPKYGHSASETAQEKALVPFHGMVMPFHRSHTTLYQIFHPNPEPRGGREGGRGRERGPGGTGWCLRPQFRCGSGGGGPLGQKRANKPHGDHKSPGSVKWLFI